MESFVLPPFLALQNVIRAKTWPFFARFPESCRSSELDNFIALYAFDPADVEICFNWWLLLLGEHVGADEPENALARFQLYWRQAL